MKFLSKVLAVVLGLHLFVPLAVADQEISAEKRRVITELLVICDAMMDTDQMLEQMMAGLYEEVGRQNPDIPERVLEVMEEEYFLVLRDHQRELRGQMMISYDRHFTFDELEQMVEFYQTPLGRKITEVTPIISEEIVASLAASNVQFAQAVTRVQKRLKDEGISVPAR